jgi:hypothetical protein
MLKKKGLDFLREENLDGSWFADLIGSGIICILLVVLALVAFEIKSKG